MRKTNKVLSLTVAGLMAFSTSAVTAFSVSAAEDVTDTKIYFEVPTEIWADALVKTDVSELKVYAHTYAVAGDPDYKETSWQTKGEVCKYVSGNIYSYDIDAKYKRTLKDGADYVAIFSIVGDKGYQTCNVTMGSHATAIQSLLQAKHTKTLKTHRKRTIDQFGRARLMPLFTVLSSKSHQQVV